MPEQHKYTVQEVLNRIYDNSAIALSTTVSPVKNINPHRYSEQEIMNLVFNPATKVINFQ